ncbi:MAG TPA: putative lipid II flippase FtsW [Gammaproteobacteria bacterium]|nr:putative lipid II flippase FtsW [Gammaproteobacteria bacterium]
MLNAVLTSRAVPPRSRPGSEAWVDPWVSGLVLALLLLGLVMLASASMALMAAEGHGPFHLFLRQLLFALLAVVVAVAVVHCPLRLWSRLGVVLLLLAMALLVLVLVVGELTKGSTRWLSLGLFNFQPSELAKLLLIVYLAGYLVRHGQAVRETAAGFLKPMLVVGVVGLLLVLEPDYGAFAVITATALGLLFLGGVHLVPFGGTLAGAGAIFAGLVMANPERLSRVLAFLDPRADAAGDGYQLIQSEVAFGRGELLGAGLGESVQKMLYLPEAETDFLFAVLGEELGLLGTATVIVLYALLVWRMGMIARRAEQAGQHFGAFLAYGVGIWLGLQAFVNMGVNMGLLPTKGITLPLMSYGGSSLLITLIAVALVLRVDRETRFPALRGGV